MGDARTIVTDPPFFFDGARLADLAAQHHDSYASAAPFPHVVLDDFVPDSLIDALLSEFPEPGNRSAAWEKLDHGKERKLALAADARMGPVTRQVLAQCNSSTFVEFLEALTGISGLIPDPHFVGGGLHQIEPGGFLKVHADFNTHKRLRLDRRLNVLLYLNRDWPDAYGGHLQLWDREMRRCERSVLPIAGRCVVFSTTDTSYHGHPDPLTCPPDRTRKSLALYYYSNGRPAEEMSDDHTTLFKARPDERLKGRPAARDLARRWLPPAVVDAARQAKGRLRSGRA